VDGTAADLIEHLLQGGGRLPPQAAAELAAFLPGALRALLAEPGAGGGNAALRRLWQAAPVPEVIPSLLSLAARPGADR
jgi:hypothetical protein